MLEMTRTVRKASFEDYDCVVAISENATIYGGYDYLPREFENIMTRHDGFILEMDNQVVGFLAFALTDGGESFTPIGGRIREDYQNLGLFKFLLDAVTKHVLDTYPAVTSRRMSIEESNPHMNRLLETHSVVYRGIFACMTSNELPIGICDAGEIGARDQIYELSVCDLKRLADAENGLFSNGYFLHDWHVYRFNSTEVASLFKEHTNFHCIASMRGDPSEGAIVDSVTALTMFSINRYGDGDGAKIDLDFFGHFSDGILKRHIGEAFRVVRREGIEWDALQIVAPDELKSLVRATFVEQSCEAIIGLELSLCDTALKK